jgi:hypothetical protein
MVKLALLLAIDDTSVVIVSAETALQFRAAIHAITTCKKLLLVQDEAS